MLIPSGQWEPEERSKDCCFARQSKDPNLETTVPSEPLRSRPCKLLPPTYPVTPRHLAGNTRGTSGKKVAVFLGLVSGKGGAYPGEAGEQGGNSMCHSSKD